MLMICSCDEILFLAVKKDVRFVGACRAEGVPSAWHVMWRRAARGDVSIRERGRIEGQSLDNLSSPI